MEESVASMKRGDRPSSPSPIWRESTLKKISFGNKDIAKTLNEVIKEYQKNYLANNQLYLVYEKVYT